jgi:phospholipid/cholesterol/gamma-HCH transport system substrate-binding protein
MTTPTNHWKLGAFVVVATCCAFGALIWLGSQSFREETVRYVSYFDEQVTGLEIGSPVSFRGVRIGNVAEIDIAPDRRHVEVGLELSVKLLSRLGLVRKQRRHIQLNVPADVRVQVASSGVTGVKHIKLDYLRDVPAPELPFPVPENYIPASPSTLKNLEDAVMKALDQLPQVVEKALAVLAHTDLVIQDVHAQKLPQRAALLLDHADQAVGVVETKAAALDTLGLSQKAKQALGEMNQVLARVDGILARVEAKDGLLASVQRATDAVGDVAINVRGTGPRLNQTLEQIADLSRSLSRLLDELERDPDMLLKGHAGGER